MSSDGPADLEDAALAHRIGRGDLEAFAALYRRSRERLFSLCLLVTSDRQRAEDVLQDVFVRLAERAELLRDVRSLEAYLLRACIHRARDLRRRRAERSGTPDAAGVWPAADEGGPSQHAVRREERERVRACVRRLPREQREVVALRVFGGLRFREIAALLDENVNTVQSRHRQALEALRAMLAPRESTP